MRFFVSVIIVSQILCSCDGVPVQTVKLHTQEFVISEALKRANEYYEKDDFYNASLALDSILLVDSNNGEVYYKKAVCLIFSEQNDSAIIYFERSADLEYKKADSFYNIGMMYYHLGSDSLSLVYLDKVLSISPNDSFALNIKEKLLDRTNGQKNEGHSKFDFSSL